MPARSNQYRWEWLHAVRNKRTVIFTLRYIKYKHKVLARLELFSAKIATQSKLFFFSVLLPVVCASLLLRCLHLASCKPQRLQDA